MKATIVLLTAAAGTLVFASGCSFPSSRRVVPSAQANVLQRSELGVVTSVRDVNIEGSKGQIGLYGGGVVGGALASGGKGVTGAETKEGDFLWNLFVASTHDFLLFFSDKGRVYWKKVYELPSLGRTAKGRAIVNLLELREGEKVKTFLPIEDFEKKSTVPRLWVGAINPRGNQSTEHPKISGMTSS